MSVCILLHFHRHEQVILKGFQRCYLYIKGNVVMPCLPLPNQRVWRWNCMLWWDPFQMAHLNNGPQSEWTASPCDLPDVCQHSTPNQSLRGAKCPLRTRHPSWQQKPSLDTAPKPPIDFSVVKYSQIISGGRGETPHKRITHQVKRSQSFK